MTTKRLPLTLEIQDLVKHGKMAEAKRQHTRNVHALFELAKTGETINLSDLMASREEILQGEEGPR